MTQRADARCVSTSALVCLVGAVACGVSHAEHDAARAAHEADRARFADAEGKLRARVRDLERRVSSHRQGEERADQTASQAEYGQAVAEMELDTTKRVASQLHEELQRAADHLRQFARRSETLAATVADLEKAAADLQRRVTPEMSTRRSRGV